MPLASALTVSFCYILYHGRVTAIKERKKALAGSVVKIAGRDVMLSKKIMISIVMVPLLWLFYAVLMMALTDWELSTKVSSLTSLHLGKTDPDTDQTRLNTRAPKAEDRP